MDKRRKLIGALLAACLVLLYYGGILFLAYSVGFFSDNEIPKFIIFILLGAFLIPIIGITVALVSRVQEIHSGEEEEAKKY